LKRYKIKFKRLFIVLTILVIAVIASMASFLFTVDAPIIHGNVFHQVEYKDGLNLDIYSPTIKKYDKTPVILFFHGGAWITGTKESINFN